MHLYDYILLVFANSDQIESDTHFRDNEPIRLRWLDLNCMHLVCQSPLHTGSHACRMTRKTQPIRK